MLSGNIPYYKGKSADEYLHLRLQEESDNPLVLQNLEFLSEGLQGRSNNPVSLLFDALAHPDADLGIHKDSLMDWKYDPNFSFSHVVLGRGCPGGTWASMEGEFLTLSLGSWMELPNLKIKEYIQSICGVDKEGSRVPISAVAEYYKSYVDKMGLFNNFINGVEVTSVTKLRDKDTSGYYYALEDESDSDVSECQTSFNSCRRCYMDEYSARDEELERMMTKISSNCSWDPICNPSLYSSPCHFFNPASSTSTSTSSSSTSPPSTSSSNTLSSNKKDEENEGTLWKVSGFRKDDNGIFPFTYITPSVVLAAGSYDNSNKLKCRGEMEAESRIIRSLRDFEHHLEEIQESKLPICIIGSGLSAADAVLAALQHKIKVIHSFRRQPHDPNFIYSKLPKVSYPEYHRFHKMMKFEITSPYYTPIPSTLVKTTALKDGFVRITFSDGQIVDASFLISLIGSFSNLSFIEGHEELGILPDQPISRDNPIYIDTYTHECISHPGVYAMGPLVGDNFVRFLQGGALAISSDLVKRKEKKNQFLMKEL
ncbi:oxidative stress-induced growth inhibitor 1 isoform X2 [Lepeophtheirus salmonis]|nr:oxidative stress-induced growth inhibitor 2-like isoform X2 [Lepeophtheirus salmonis]